MTVKADDDIIPLHPLCNEPGGWIEARCCARRAFPEQSRRAEVGSSAEQTQRSAHLPYLALELGLMPLIFDFL
jgi:hypothetical protein